MSAPRRYRRSLRLFIAVHVAQGHSRSFPAHVIHQVNAQLELEVDAYNSESAQRAFGQGWSVYEFYEAVGIDTELRG